MIDLDFSIGESVLGCKKTAIDIFLKFQMTLPKDITALNQACQKSDQESIKNIIHRICGASYYSSTPRLNKILKSIDEHLQNTTEETLSINEKGTTNSTQDILIINETTKQTLKKIHISIGVWEYLNDLLKIIMSHKIKSESLY